MECGRKALEIAINMKVNILRIKNMDMVSSPGQVETFIKETMMQIFGATSDRCIGVMVATIKANGLTESSMVREYYLSQVKELKKAYLKIIN